MFEMRQLCCRGELYERGRLACLCYNHGMTLTLSSIADNPGLATYPFALASGEQEVLRPLLLDDINKLGNFLLGLSDETKRLVTSADSHLPTAVELCEAINKYDKLRFVVETVPEPEADKRIVGLMEFSFDIPEGDIERYRSAGYDLDQKTDCRFGPTIADDYQNKGLGSELFPYVKKIAQQFGKKRIILWGGVLKDNERAIHYYEKHGFKTVGEFSDDDSEMVDMILDLDDFETV